jgi:hypothetical protein
MMIPVGEFNFWNYNTSLTVESNIATEVAAISADISKNRMPIANLFQTLGGAIQDVSGMQSAMKTPIAASTKVVAAHMVVYASWRIAACVARKVGRKTDGNGHTIVFTSDLYFAVIWVCLALRRALDSLDPTTTDWTFDDVMYVLSDAFNEEEKFSAPDERYTNIWVQTEVYATLGYFVGLGYANLSNTAFGGGMMLPGQSGLNATFQFTTVTQASIAEALFMKYMEMMATDSTPTDYLTRVSYVPLSMDQLSNDTLAYAAFQTEWLPSDPATAAQIPETLLGLEVKYDQVICGPPDDPTKCARKGKDFYWDDDAKMCKRISDDPNAYCQYRHHKDPSVGPAWDPTSSTCVFPPTPREKCDKTPGYHWEGDDDTGTCVPDTPTPDPKADCDKRAASGEDVYWDGKACVPLTPEMLCNKRKAAGEDVEWDGTNCIKKLTPIPTPPSGGGGGGGGGGGSGPALFIGILALLALFGRR